MCEPGVLCHMVGSSSGLLKSYTVAYFGETAKGSSASNLFPDSHTLTHTYNRRGKEGVLCSLQVPFLWGPFHVTSSR